MTTDTPTQSLTPEQVVELREHLVALQSRDWARAEFSVATILALLNEWERLREVLRPFEPLLILLDHSMPDILTEDIMRRMDDIWIAIGKIKLSEVRAARTTLTKGSHDHVL